MTALLGLLVGAAFGAALIASDLAHPDRIVGTLRLRDFHAMRVIAVFLIGGMTGVWGLELLGLAHFSVKPAALVAVTLGGAILGCGFGLTGYCPGTGLACAASGRVDAAVTLLGMLAGTAVYIATYGAFAEPVAKLLDFGKTTLPELTGIPKAVWVLGLATGGSAVLWLTRNRHTSSLTGE